MSAPTDSLDLIRRVVRGEADVDRLTEFGVRYWYSSHAFHMTFSGAMPVLAPDLADFATGVLAYWARSGDEAQLWARLILGADIDAQSLNESEAGDQILEAIWSLTEGAPLSEETLALLRHHAA